MNKLKIKFMAQRRMFSLQIVDSDAFLDMPASSQAYYFHLAMRGDDDGFVDNPRKIMKIVGAQEDDFKILIGKRFLLTFESGVVVVKHWKIHNYIQNDRYRETKYLDEKSKITLKDNGSYTERIQDVSSVDTQVRLGEVSLGKDRLEGEDTPAQKARKFFTDGQEYARVLVELVNAEIPEQVASNELSKFRDYWTEPNKSGTKQRWELEKTFELGRRLATWFRNFQGFNQKIKNKTSAIQI